MEKPTIEELEKILAGNGDDIEIEILPDGSIHTVAKGKAQDACFNPLPTIDYY